MKNKLLALTALSLVASATFAQNVTVYGVLDTGIMTQSKTASSTNAAINAGSKTAMLSGGIHPSIWGLTGTEDLGGGLKANFNLQSHIFVDTGSSIDGQGLFTRSANVGLSGSFGSLTLGRVYDPAFLSFGLTDPAGFRENFSGSSAIQKATNASRGGLGDDATSYNLDKAGVFNSNAVVYSYAANGLGFNVMYSFGEKAGNSNANEVMSLSMTYKGPILFSATYGTAKNASGQKTGNVYSTGIGYPMGNLTLKANYMNGKADNNTYENQTWTVGGDYKVSANGLIRAAYFRSEDKKFANSESDNLVLGYEHSLSKRTTLYAQTAYTKRGSTTSTNYSLDLVGSTPVGTSSTVLNTGIKHAF